MDIHRARVRLLEPDDDLQQNTLAGTTAAEHRERFTAGDRQVNPVQDHLGAEGLVQTSQDHGRFAIRFLKVFYHDAVQAPFRAPLRTLKRRPSWKEHDDQFHHDNVGQDYKQRR